MLPSPVADLNAFVPAKDFERSQRFYADLGFTRMWGNADVAQFEAGGSGSCSRTSTSSRSPRTS